MGKTQAHGADGRVVRAAQPGALWPQAGERRGRRRSWDSGSGPGNILVSDGAWFKAPRLCGFLTAAPGNKHTEHTNLREKNTARPECGFTVQPGLRSVERLPR